MNDSTTPKPPTPDNLPEHLDYLKLVFVREHYEPLAKEAAEAHWGHVDYLASLVEGEALERRPRSIQRRIRQARFPVITTLEPFQWTWPRKINRLQVQNLFRLKFIEDKANVIFLGGVGLGKTLERRGQWQQLIASVRQLYSGAVTYAGNWHSDYDRVTFWDRLDFIGVDAYFPLADSAQAAPATISAGARGVAERLRQAAEHYRKPVILTELGYAARAGAWVEPHTEGGDFSTEHQALAYRALFDALGRPPWLRGIFAWKAFSADRGGDSGTRADFRFLGRPAEAVLRDYFSPPQSAGSHASDP